MGCILMFLPKPGRDTNTRVTTLVVQCSGLRGSLGVVVVVIVGQWCTGSRCEYELGMRGLAIVQEQPGPGRENRIGIETF